MSRTPFWLHLQNQRMLRGIPPVRRVPIEVSSISVEGIGEIYLGSPVLGPLRPVTLSRVQRTEISALPPLEKTVCAKCKGSGKCEACGGSGEVCEGPAGYECEACEGDGRCAECP